ncbi:unnamed protein product [Symbiodinium sp. CCMP2592]|nr:unnamed protein product [Symbiodinium sp. CCMP2592]
MQCLALCLLAVLAQAASQPANGSCNLQAVKAGVSSVANGTQSPALSFGCPELCMWDTVNATKRVLLSGHVYRCSQLKSFVEDEADSRDCLSLIDTLAPPLLHW